MLLTFRCQNNTDLLGRDLFGSELIDIDKPSAGRIDIELLGARLPVAGTPMKQ